MLSTAGAVGFVVAVEIVGFEKKKDAAAGLVADARFLLVAVGAGEQKTRPSTAAGGDDDPALLAHRDVLLEREAEFVGEPRDRFIIVADDKGDGGEGLAHAGVVAACVQKQNRPGLWPGR